MILIVIIAILGFNLVKSKFILWNFQERLSFWVSEHISFL